MSETVPAAETATPASPGTVDLTTIVSAFYRTLLLREPEAAGLNAHLVRVQSGEATVETMLAAFVRSAEFRAALPRLLGPDVARRKTGRFTNDHTQHGEFEILLRLWVNAFAKHKIVVDVGARGRDRSNSYDLLREFGWRGLLVEANPALIGGIHKDFGGLDYSIINAAISDYDGQASFYIGVNDDVSSLSETQAAGWGAVQGNVTVAVKRLAPQLQLHGIPQDFDLLSLDIEGEDMKVLNDLIGEGVYRPRWVIIEASYNFAAKALKDVGASEAVQVSYAIAGQTTANLILKHSLA